MSGLFFKPIHLHLEFANLAIKPILLSLVILFPLFLRAAENIKPGQ